MARRFVDLSIFLENDVVSDPPAFAPKIQYFTHENSFEQIAPFFPGLKKQDLPDGEGWAVETVQLSTHNGTHLDAPYHFHSTMDKALGAQKPSIAIHDAMSSPPATSRRNSSASGTRSSRWRSLPSTPAPARVTATTTTSRPAAAWATRRPCTCWSAACA
jgi:hypothetical protein